MTDKQSPRQKEISLQSDEDDEQSVHADQEHHPKKKEKKSKEKEKLTIDKLVIKSPLQGLSAEEQAEKILELYNANITDSCFTLKVMPGRALHRVPISSFLLGHRNQVAELADPKGQRCALVFNTNPLITQEVIGTVEKTAPFFGAYGKYVLNVPAGYFAKAYSKNQPLLYGPGPHVVIDPTFKFEPKDGFVNQLEPYIQHSTMHILRVPAGKVAKAWLGTIPRIFESRKEPYVFNDPQFSLVTKDAKGNDKGSALFESATARYIEHGSIKRIIPHTGEVAITYNNGILEVIRPPKDGHPVIIDSATHNFDGFISTALQTYLFPSDEMKTQTVKDNPHATADERNLKVFQTRDSLRIGVVLVVAFKIVDPEVAITKLGKDGILPHIENIAFADMGKAIQLNTVQEVLYSNQTKPNSDPEHSITIQDQVRKNLARDLQEYGIELARLNIETMKVLDEEIAKKLAGQSVTSAEFTTKQASLVKEYDIKTTEARLRAETDNIALQQRNNALIAEAQAKLDSAKREADALLIAADAKRKASEMQGELYTKFPQLYELELAKIKAEAIKKATIYITPQDMSNLFNSVSLFSAFGQQPPQPRQ